MSAITIKIQRKGYRPNPVKFTEKLYKNMHDNFMTATQAFVNAMKLELLAHVDTGMTYGATEPMARLVKSKMAGIVIPGIEKWKGYTLISGQYVRGIKSYYTGLRIAKSMGRSVFDLQFGSKVRPIFKLFYDYSIYQHHFHDGKWHSLDNAIIAFHAIMRVTMSQNIPLMNEYMDPITEVR